MNKLLVLVLDEFQDYEMIAVCSTLERAKTFDQIVFYNPNTTKTYTGQHKLVNLQTEKISDFSEFSAIFVPGGKGATHLRTDQKSLDLLKKFLDENKWVFAICDAPNALFEKKVFDQTINYTAFPNASLKGQNYKDNGVVVDNKVITGRSAYYSIDFALEIIERLQSKQKREEILKALVG
ncbi:DJ-1/PfpI family protein [Mycoplasma procyoni]|uniref:DJ-1/PfpI family protein n=1 Tax=Mycoplasma procyoni TaxID=568784 RepID=UPI00197C63F0|nr:DJ-1/PfpI family protein [Mycoplasma procyoni]MBN3534396.1 DJ-1/PfpI family protein [Mycoplasma procyoni]